MTRREGRALRRRRIATATGVVTVAALGLRAAATVARQRTRDGAPRPRRHVRTLAAPPPSAPKPEASTTWEPPPPRQLVRRRGRQSTSATVIAIAFALGGSTLIGVAIASQRPAPAAPALTAVVDESPEPLSAPRGPAPQRPEAWRRAAQAAVQPPAPAGRERAAADAAAQSSGARETSGRSPLAPSKPVTISIPAIGVRSVVRHLGQAANGSLEVPAGAQYNDAAWYRHSPTPGSLGPAVMLGHVDSAAQGPSVFFRLGELRPGNRVTVTRADGSAAVFVVDDVRRYSKKSFPTELVYSDIDHAGLRILTCGGAFDDAAGSYLDNIVVFASLVDAGA